MQGVEQCREERAEEPQIGTRAPVECRSFVGRTIIFADGGSSTAPFAMQAARCDADVIEVRCSGPITCGAQRARVSPPTHENDTRLQWLRASILGDAVQARHLHAPSSRPSHPHRSNRTRLRLHSCTRSTSTSSRPVVHRLRRSEVT